MRFIILFWTFLIASGVEASDLSGYYEARSGSAWAVVQERAAGQEAWGLVVVPGELGIMAQLFSIHVGAPTLWKPLLLNSSNVLVEPSNTLGFRSVLTKDRKKTTLELSALSTDCSSLSFVKKELTLSPWLNWEGENSYLKLKSSTKLGERRMNLYPIEKTMEGDFFSLGTTPVKRNYALEEFAPGIHIAREFTMNHGRETLEPSIEALLVSVNVPGNFSSQQKQFVAVGVAEENGASTCLLPGVGFRIEGGR
jgi:hypothetical protein